MKIPLDLFLRLVQRLAENLNQSELSEVINKFLENPEEDYVRNSI